MTEYSEFSDEISDVEREIFANRFNINAADIAAIRSGDKVIGSTGRIVLTVIIEPKQITENPESIA